MTRLVLALALLLPAPSLAAEAESADEVLAQAREIYTSQGPRLALPEYERALALYRQAGDRLGEAVTLGYLGNCHKRFGEFDRALELLESALAMKRELGDRGEQGKTLSHLGLVHWELGEYETASERFVAAAELARQAGDRRTEGAALNNLALVHDELGEYERSMELYQRVLAIYDDIDFPRGESDTLGNIGGVHLLLGRFREALDHYRRSLAIAEAEELVPSICQDLLNLALAHLGLGQVETALSHADRALELARETGLRPEVAYALRARGDALLRLGRYDEGLADHREAVAIYDQIGARGDQVEALGELGSLLLELGDLASADEYLRRAAELARQTGDAQGLTRALLDLGGLESARRRYEQAGALFRQALERAEAADELSLAVRGSQALAETYRDQGRLEEAAASAGRALELAREIGGTLLEARALWILGEIELADGQPGAALARFEAGTALAAPVGDPDLLWRLHHGRGRALAAAERPEQAVEALKTAVGVIESVRGRLREERFRAGYVERKQRVYVDLVRLLLELDRAEEALESAERLRARSFLELRERGPASGDGDGDEASRREVELRERVRRLQRALEEETGGSASWRREPAVELFSRELAAAERDYQAFLDDRMGRAGPPPAAAFALPSLDEVRRRLPPDAALVEYLVTDGELVTFVLTRERVRAANVPLRERELSAKVELYRDLLLRAEDQLWRGPALSLGELLIGPIERAGWLAGRERLILVPHGALHYVPFAALLRDGAGGERPLIRDYYVSYLPSASALVRPAGGDRPAATLLALAPARSRLRWAPDEVRGIARLHPASAALLGEEATETAFKQRAASYRLLHLATHGHFNRLNPLLSALELEPGGDDDGRLEVHEILGLRLSAQLVTLSACDTALASGHFTQFPAGDDFVGLTRAFLVAGSASVLATLWRVEDRSTLALMRGFYERLARQGGDGVVTALVLAQREMAGSNSRYRHPYYWAPFVLIGGASGDRGGRAARPIRVQGATPVRHAGDG